ncbi:phosphocholine cytidylyltransferase family protein [Tahibacter soli]|jgi:choline kinase|uniref:Phosphocholine cytidylyltransferase family protein n=1 Tax=Tahibacter soli TaxID=2983605 RepID=A0A9X3YLA7_9GAMM|nr:phosphocholine cytidylyltransferase family protein [Tahibacter soli]MDC8014362.1 phosphocholine cytidylyltransferase family protein [Tahibacter soli]
MHAVILAAGSGSRMGRFTRTRPKAMLALAGRSLLAWQRGALATAGIDETTVVTGHAHTAVHADGCRIVHNADWADSGPIASLRCARPATLGDVLLVYGDGVFHPSFAHALAASRADVAITVDRQWRALWSRRFDDVLADAESLRHADGRLIEIGRRATDAAAIEAQFTGLVRFSAAGWAHAERALAALPEERQRRIDTTALLALLLEAGVAIETVAVDGRWCEVDSARDLALYRLLAHRSPGWSHDWRWSGA